jgi:hypothetical protein
MTEENQFRKDAKIRAVSHHEKGDGIGYPRGLKENEITLLGRIMAIADVYDALVSERPYKKAFTHEEAISIILDNKGKHFDPFLIDLFLVVYEKFKKYIPRRAERRPPVLRAIICYTLNRDVYFMAENKQETDNLEQTLKRIREAQRIYSGYNQSQVDKIFFAAA